MPEPKGRPVRDKNRRAVFEAMLEMNLEASVFQRLKVPRVRVTSRTRFELSQFFKLAMDLAKIQDREEDLTIGIWTE